MNDSELTDVDELFEQAYMGISVAMENDSPEDFYTFLDMMLTSFADNYPEDKDELFHDLLLWSYSMCNLPFAKIIISQYENHNEEDAMFKSVYTKAIILPVKDPNFFKFLATIDPDGDYVLQTHALSRMPLEKPTYQGMKNLEIMYGSQDYNKYLMLKIQLEESSRNADVYSFIISRMRMMEHRSVQLDAYDYINNVITLNGLTLKADDIENEIIKTVKIPTVREKLANLILLDHRTVKHDNLMKELNGKTNKEFKAISKKYAITRAQLHVGENEEIVRIFGPSHPLSTNIEFSTNEHGGCHKYGGCHMLLCQGHDDSNTIDDFYEDQPVPDWFTGGCLFCESIIDHRYEAKRMPLSTGGWGSSSYCSWAHVKADCPSENPLSNVYIDLFERKIKKIGTYMRPLEIKGLPEEEIMDDGGDLMYTISGRERPISQIKPVTSQFMYYF